MKICLVGYIDNTPENKQMLDTYEFKNDFWAENFKFRRRDGKQVTDDELKQVSKWLDREVIKKHRTNWLSEKNPEYIDVKDPSVIKKYCPWMSDEDIQKRLESERQHEFFEKMRKEISPYNWEHMVMTSPPTYYPTPPSMAKQLELKFNDLKKQGDIKEVIKKKRRCPECGNYLDSSSDCDYCGWPYHVPSWGVHPLTGMFDKTKED